MVLSLCSDFLCFIEEGESSSILRLIVRSILKTDKQLNKLD